MFDSEFLLLKNEAERNTLHTRQILFVLFVKLVFDGYIAHALLLFYHPESLISLHTHSVIKYKYAELPYL